MKLYQLTSQYTELQSMDIDEDVLHDTLEGLTGEIEIKAENLLAVVANMDGDITTVDTEIKRLQARKKALTGRKEWLRNYLRTNMEESGISKIDCPLFTITLVHGRDMVEVSSVDKLPPEYIQTICTIKPVKANILAALKEGMDVPGAYLIKSKSSIRIK